MYLRISHYQQKSFMLEVCVKFYWNPIIIENFKLSGKGEGKKGTLRSCTIRQYYLNFYIRRTWNFQLKFDHNWKFDTLGMGERECGGGGGFVISTPQKFTIRHYYLLKFSEVREKFYWNLIIIENFRPSGERRCTILGERRKTLLNSQSSFDHGIINFYDFQGHSSNTYTRIHNHN